MKIAVLPGDGIGPEVINEAKKVLTRAGEIFGLTLKTRDFPFGAERYLKTKETLPKGAFDDIGENDALLLGAIGDPRVPAGPLEQELILALRFHFDQYANLRPARSMPGVPSPVPGADVEPLDILVVRENTEDFYVNLGGRTAGSPIGENIKIERGLYKGKGSIALEFEPPVSAAFSLGILTEPGTRRVAKKAFELARLRGEKKVKVATKSNALPHIYGHWDSIVSETAKAEFPGGEIKTLNVDNLAYQLVRSPRDFGVILCPNLFGDIISDLTAGLAGGLGLAPSANIGDGLSMFEPVHGSAPDIAGTGKANPLAAILSAALMLDHLNEKAAARAVEKAAEDYLRSVPREDFPFELGGKADTERVGDLVLERLKNPG
jgi:3-isopropylmalate dehydrogenase